MRQATGEMEAVISELLEAARIRTGQPLDLDRRPTDLVQLVQRQVGVWKHTTERHALRVEAALPELIGNWDTERLERVLDNLLSNAVKFSPGGGTVTVTVTEEPAGAAHWAVLSVTDEGQGVPAADLPHIFGEFRRGANVGGIDGTGLGLAAVRRIVEQHGGVVAISSEEGAGTTVALRLPLGQAGSHS